MEVAELWRFPVKSVGGERLQRVTVGPGGLEGDRGWAIWDLRDGLGLTARRSPSCSSPRRPSRSPGASRSRCRMVEVAADDGALSRCARTPGGSSAMRLPAASAVRTRPIPSAEADAPWQAFTGAEVRSTNSPHGRRVTSLSTHSLRTRSSPRSRAYLVRHLGARVACRTTPTSAGRSSPSGACRKARYDLLPAQPRLASTSLDAAQERPSARRDYFAFHHGITRIGLRLERPLSFGRCSTSSQTASRRPSPTSARAAS